jgi:hypothetical protein
MTYVNSWCNMHRHRSGRNSCIVHSQPLWRCTRHSLYMMMVMLLGKTDLCDMRLKHCTFEAEYGSKNLDIKSML